MFHYVSGRDIWPYRALESTANAVESICSRHHLLSNFIMFGTAVLFSVSPHSILALFLFSTQLPDPENLLQVDANRWFRPTTLLTSGLPASSISLALYIAVLSLQFSPHGMSRILNHQHFRYPKWRHSSIRNILIALQTYFKSIIQYLSL